MLKKKGNYYYESFIVISNLLYDSSLLFQKAICDYNYKHLDNLKNEINIIKEKANKIKDDIFKKLFKEFITPIEIEDIIHLGNAMNNTIRKEEEIVLLLYMYNVKDLRKEAVLFSELVFECAESLSRVIKEFNSFKDTSKIIKLIDILKEIEKKVAKQYVLSVRKLFEASRDSIELLIWKDLYYCFKECCMKIINVGDIVREIILKNM